MDIKATYKDRPNLFNAIASATFLSVISLAGKKIPVCKISTKTAIFAGVGSVATNNLLKEDRNAIAGIALVLLCGSQIPFLARRLPTVCTLDNIKGVAAWTTATTLLTLALAFALRQTGKSVALSTIGEIDKLCTIEEIANSLTPEKIAKFPRELMNALLARLEVLIDKDTTKDAATALAGLIARAHNHLKVYKNKETITPEDEILTADQISKLRNKFPKLQLESLPRKNT